ncbi:MAG TPA: hypothetical protein VHH15_21995 [Actinophytocola sp.]|nr:hypothetical protein [Actinophytocola sp.]
MSGLDFFVDLAVTGTVLGLDHTSDRAAVRAALADGADLDDTYDVDSFGIVEFGWHREAHRTVAAYYGAQAHRLRLRPSWVERVLVEHYGEFPDRVDVDELRTAAAERGFPLEEWPTANEGYVEYRAPISRIGVLAVVDPAEAGGLPAGTVMKMLGPTRRSPMTDFPGGHRHFRPLADHLLALREDERAAWLTEREPAGPPRADWWRSLCFAVRPSHDTHSATHPARRRLALALHAAATEHGVLPADEAVRTEIELLADAAEHGDQDGAADMDRAVRRWLDTTPAPLADATDQELRVSRLLRDRIHDAERGLPWVVDPALADELRAWSAVKPLVLGGLRPTG